MRRPRRRHADNVTLNVAPDHQPAGSPGDRRLVVGGASDRRHRGRPELGRRPVRGVPLRPARMPRDRLLQRARPSSSVPRPAGPRPGRALPGQPPASTYPPYRLDDVREHRARSSASRRRCRRPLPRRQCDGSATPVQYWVPFVAGPGRQAGTVYSGGTAGCAGEPPESQDVGGVGPAEQRDVRRDRDQRQGSAEFDVFTSAENATLGCSQGGLLSGGRADHGHQLRHALAAHRRPQPSRPTLAQCEATGAYAPGSVGDIGADAGDADLAVTGSLWWSPSNWRNRISGAADVRPVPPSACGIVTADKGHRRLRLRDS